MERDRNSKLKDEDKKNILRKTTEGRSDGASSSRENKNLETSKNAPKSSQKEETRRSKTPPPARNSSPEPNCAICLGQLQNKSFTDSCFHMFCFTCLVEWSKVKPECPLCKQKFSSIVHNVRSFQEYDQYFINQSRISLSVVDGRFRVSTNLSNDFLEFSFSNSSGINYSGGIESEIASHRMRYAPHSVHPVGMYASPQTVRRAPCSFRRRIYEQNLWVRPSESSRTRCITPSFFQRNIACTHRLLPWLNRELLVVMPNNESQISFVVELIMSLIARYEITSQEFYTHIEPYTSSYTAHFIHEFYNFAISPFSSLNNYDVHAEYFSDSPAVQSASSSDSDVIPLGGNQPTNKSTNSESRRKRQHHSKKKHSKEYKEYKKLKKIILKRNREDCWETFIPSRSSFPYGEYPYGESISGSSGHMPGPSTSRNNPFLDFRRQPINQELEGSNEVECLEGKDDEECQVVEVLKPKRERTPEIVNLSSDDDLTSSSVNIREDAFMARYNNMITSPESPSNSDNDLKKETSSSVNIREDAFMARYNNMITSPESPSNSDNDLKKETSSSVNFREDAFMARYNNLITSPESPSNDDSDNDIIILSETKKDSNPPDKPIDYSLKTIVKKFDVSSEVKDAEPSTSSSSSKKTEQELSDQQRNSVIQSAPNLSNDDASPSLKSPFKWPKNSRSVILDDSSTESCSEGSQVTEINSRKKKLKLRSVIAHFSYDPNDEHNDSAHHSSSHKRHKDRRKKKKKHKHKRLDSSDSN